MMFLICAAELLSEFGKVHILVQCVQARTLENPVLGSHVSAGVQITWQLLVLEGFMYNCWLSDACGHDI